MTDRLTNIGHYHCALRPRIGQIDSGTFRATCPLTNHINSSRTYSSKTIFPDLTIRNPSALRQAKQHFDTTFSLTILWGYMYV